MPSLIRHLALISESAFIGQGDVMAMAAALQKQASRDLAPIWDIGATVDPFPNLHAVPTDYWPIIIRDDIEDRGLAGIHKAGDGQPFGLVTAFGGDLDMVSLTASHEMLEMLVDPSGERWVAGECPDPRQGRVNFLVEIADPCMGREHAYQANSVWVSDFYTPRYFDPVPSASVRYSFTGAIRAPRQVLPGGYLSWRNLTDGHIYQQSWFEGAAPRIQRVPALSGFGSPRAQIDARTADARHERNRLLVEARREDGDRPSLQAASEARARQLRSQIDEILANPAP